MTYDSDSPTGQAYLTDAVLWLLGTPLAILDVLYLAYGAPPITPNAPETLVVWVLGLIALSLLAWNLLSSACAHLATLRHVPDPLRRAAHLLVSRFGTRLSRSLLARAGASALIGSALVTSVPLGGALAAPQDTGPRGVSLTWADSPKSPPTHPPRPPQPRAPTRKAAPLRTRTPQEPHSPGRTLPPRRSRRRQEARRQPPPQPQDSRGRATQAMPHRLPRYPTQHSHPGPPPTCPRR